MWVAARLLPQKEALALHCLKLNGYPTVYLPRIRERRVVRRRAIETARPVFPGYCFVVVESQWHAAPVSARSVLQPPVPRRARNLRLPTQPSLEHREPGASHA